ncbi:MAG: hypothetical protein ABIT69_05090 [Sphingomicrobium sp.]
MGRADGEIDLAIVSAWARAIGPQRVVLRWARYDLVNLGIASVDGRARQDAIRAGANYDLPHTNKLVNLHVEYARNAVRGPSAIVAGRNPADEFSVELRASLQRYLRH